jgi:hypothetical protein
MSTSNVEIVDAVVRFMYNESPMNIFEIVYGPDHDDRYRQEKLPLIRSHFIYWWGTLDEDHREILMKAALNRAEIR